MKQYNWNKDKVWNTVKEQLDKERRRRFLLYWSIGLVMLVPLLIGTYYLMDPTDQNQNIQEKNKATATLEKSSHSARNEAIQNIENEVATDTITSYSDNHIGREVRANEPGKYTEVKSSLNNDLAINQYSIEESEIIDKNNSMKYRDLYHQLDSETSLSTLESLPLLAPNSFKLRNQLHAVDLQDHIPIESNINRSWELSLSFNISKPKWQSSPPQNEQLVLSMSQDLILSKNLSNSISIYGGLSFEKVWITYDHTSVQKDQTEIQSDSGIVYNVGEGLSYYESGQLTQTTTVKRRIVNNNSISRISIPIGLGYQYRFNRWQLYSNLGLRLRIYQDFDGVIKNSNGEHLEDIEKIRNHRFRGNTDIGVNTQLGIAYQFLPNLSLGIHYQFKMDDVLQIHNDKIYDDLIFHGGGLSLKYSLF